ncbi:MAG: prmC [Chitinophagaceae bacterium]|nr:prmC [Chitinophagaceae bacterium]
MMTIDGSYKNFVERLRSIYDERESGNIADWVFESIAGIKRLDRVIDKQKLLNNSTIEQLSIALQQLLQHKPVQYVLGEVWFYKMKLKVNEDVLIPRPETEELVEWIVEEIRNKKLEIRNKKVQPATRNSQLAILDIGTGSGCIAIALKKELPDTTIFAIDVSEDALKVARQNAAYQNVKIDFSQLDFLNEKLWPSLPSFNIITSNPPYIPENEKNKLAKNVVEYEPHAALFVANGDPFIFYKKIGSFAEKHLNKKGEIFVEVHEDYASAVQQIFAQKEFKTEIRKDIYGRERMIKAYK